MNQNLIIIPMYNEEACLEEKMCYLYDFIKKQDIKADVVLSDNNSTDRTKEIAQDLVQRYSNIFYSFVPEKGKGNAVIKTCLNSAFDGYQTYSFMDTDLATDLAALPILLDTFERDYDIVVGSRYLEDSLVDRSKKRTIISKGYKTLFHLFFPLEIEDIQCGFKGVNKYTRDTLLPHIKNGGFFFDSELLVKAYYNNYRIKEIPVKWKEGEKSDVKLKDPFLFAKSLVFLKCEHIFKGLEINCPQ
jgi:glycosyltransferase involved in cell wall biosynthesis|tara:strand:- start:409 stop:1143 length:735 start_codon:yes stop_codon:yes gene_type:complete